MKKFRIQGILIAIICIATLCCGVLCASHLSIEISFDLSILPKVESVSDVTSYKTLKFNITDTTAKTMSVQQNTSNPPTGELIIPSVVLSDGVEYSITSIDGVDEGPMLDAYGGFYNSTGITSVVIPGTITTIPVGTFLRCTALESVTIESGVEIIEASAFALCTSLSSLVLPDSLISMGSYAFSGCVFSSVVCKSITPPTIFSSGYTHTFMDCSICPLYVPEESIELYKNSKWASFYSSIEAI